MKNQEHEEDYLEHGIVLLAKFVQRARIVIGTQKEHTKRHNKHLCTSSELMPRLKYSIFIWSSESSSRPCHLLFDLRELFPRSDPPALIRGNRLVPAFHNVVVECSDVALEDLWLCNTM